MTCAISASWLGSRKRRAGVWERQPTLAKVVDLDWPEARVMQANVGFPPFVDDANEIMPRSERELGLPACLPPATRSKVRPRSSLFDG